MSPNFYAFAGNTRNNYKVTLPEHNKLLQKNVTKD